MITRRVTNKFLTRCDYCGRVGHSMFYFTLDGTNYKVCGTVHATELEKKLTNA